MPRAIRTAGLALLIAGFVTGSPIHAAEPVVPWASVAAPTMMLEGGDMQAAGMEGMMGMMEQMNKMMGLCTKMMEGMMTTEMDKGGEPTKAP